jgi:hypothetical protein
VSSGGQYTQLSHVFCPQNALTVHVAACGRLCEFVCENAVTVLAEGRSFGSTSLSGRNGSLASIGDRTQRAGGARSVCVTPRS